MSFACSRTSCTIAAASCRQGELTEHIYAQTFDRDSNTVEVFIARLRRKLGASIIETVRGLGYRIDGSPS